MIIVSNIIINPKSMKLYANIKSERAKKGQGGNEYLDIDITVGDEHESLSKLTVRMGDYLGAEVYGLYDENDALLKYLPIKGNKQKTAKELCSCGRTQEKHAGVPGHWFK